MALNVYSTLLTPFISVVPDNLNNNYTSGSAWGTQAINTPFYPNADERFIFGIVSGVNSGTTGIYVSNRVMIDRGQAVLVTQGGINYYLIDEATIMITEMTPP